MQKGCDILANEQLDSLSDQMKAQSMINREKMSTRRILVQRLFNLLGA
jgi:hypothetical protein